MFKTTPIGSCRITWPLRHGQDTCGISLNLARNYGYCHSPAEAVQQARFMQGIFEIAPDLWPLVSPSRPRNTVMAERHETSDLYVIELSSAKELTIDGVSVQLNYVSSRFREFFSDPGRAQEFWIHARETDPEASARFLRKAWSQTEAQEEEARTLGRIRFRMADRDSLRRDLATLAEMLPDVLFVSHVDALKPDGHTIASRSSFIRMVADEVTRAGQPFFDPTLLLEEFGQEAAIEDHSTSLAHFTTSFTQAIMDHWMHEVIGPATDAAFRTGDERARAAFEHQIEADRAQGRFSRAQSRIACAGLAGADALATEHAAAAQAFETELRTIDETALDAGTATELVQRAAMLGLFETAERLAGAWRGGREGLSTHALMQTARLAKESGYTELAFGFAYDALEAADGLLGAERFIGALLSETPVSAFRALPDAAARGLLTGIAPVARIAALRMQGRSVMLALAEDVTERDLADMVAKLLEDENLADASDLMSAWREMNGRTRLRDPDLSAVLAAWTEAARGLDDPMMRLRNLLAIRRADPAHQALGAALKAHKADLVARIKAAGEAADLDSIEALGEEAALYPDPLPIYDLWQARVRFKHEDFGTAITHGEAAARHMPGTISVWVLLMRAASRSGDLGLACDFARRVVALACEKTHKFRIEAEALLADRPVDA